MTEEQQRVQDAFAPGWLKRLAESLGRDTRHWPEWRLRAVLPARSPHQEAAE